MLSKQDQLQLKEKGISIEKFENQMQMFVKGFPFLKLYAAADTTHGVYTPTEEERKTFIHGWNKALSNRKVVKFVPASGAASRMFKNLFAFLDASYDIPTTEFEKEFFNNIEQFAFSEALNDACIITTGHSLATLKEEGEYKTIVETLLEKEGLNYGSLPKGLLLFHSYPTEVRTPAEEHLIEGLLYARQGNGDVNLHFTVSPEHEILFKELIERITPEMEKRENVKFNISFSRQKDSTDTIAATPKNEPFRLEDGKMLFRPGGHGALIENLNEVEADIVFIKNIDNVVQDYLKPCTVEYKKLLAGILIDIQEKIFNYARRIDKGQLSTEEQTEMLDFLEKKLWCINEKHLEGEALTSYLKEKFNRPLRICGMVRNVGEPGGGPFLAYNDDNTISLQILESSQIDMNDSEKKRMFQSGAYFNPVDLVCGLKNYKGESYDLTKYIDHSTGFISHKSKNGRELKALELPGLWNGAMSNWNTLFVEVPLETFNPVKTVNDLLRPQHQSEK